MLNENRPKVSTQSDKIQLYKRKLSMHSQAIRTVRQWLHAKQVSQIALTPLIYSSSQSRTYSKQNRNFKSNLF